MNLYIRADADSKIGIGHIMRCIALAQAWQNRGGNVTFISRCKSIPLKQKIQEEGFNLVPLDGVCPDPTDLKSILEVLKENQTVNTENWFVLDGYHFTPYYQKAIHDTGMQLLVIDDMNHLIHYHADIIINQNSHARELTYNCAEDTILLKGASYVFLRREFLKYRSFKRQIPECAKNILVSLGGADPDNVTKKVIQALNLLSSKLQMEINIVVGPANLHKEQIKSALESTGLNYNLLVNPSDMVDLMADADLAISAGGGTYWELAYMGVPSIMIILAENQKAGAEELGKARIVLNLGWHNSLSIESLAQAIFSTAISAQARLDMIQKGRDLIDGNGAAVTIDAMKSCAARERKTA